MFCHGTDAPNDFRVANERVTDELLAGIRAAQSEVYGQAYDLTDRDDPRAAGWRLIDLVPEPRRHEVTVGLWDDHDMRRRNSVRVWAEAPIPVCAHIRLEALDEPDAPA